MVLLNCGENNPSRTRVHVDTPFGGRCRFVSHCGGNLSKRRKALEKNHRLWCEQIVSFDVPLEILHLTRKVNCVQCQLNSL